MKLYNKISYILNKKEKVQMVYILMLVTLGSALELIGVAIFTPFIECMTGNQSEISGRFKAVLNLLGVRVDYEHFLIIIASVIILIYVIKNIFLSFQKNEIYKYSYRIQHRVADMLLNAYLVEPYTFHLENNPAELVRAIYTDTDYFTKLIIHVIELTTEILVCIILGVYLFLVSPVITLVVVGLLAFFALFYAYLSKNRLKYLGRKNQEYDALIFKYLNQTFGGIKEIKVLNCEDYFLNQFSAVFNENTKCLRLSRLMSILPKYFVEAISIIGIMLAVIIMTIIDSSNVSRYISQIAVFATAAFRLMPSVGRINEHTSAIYNTIPSVNLIYHDINDIESISSKNNILRCIRGNASKMAFTNAIKIDSISFKYDNSDKDILHDVGFEIPKGKTIAFIGESGAGKTTLVDLILGVLTPNQGAILVDGVNIQSNINAWHNSVGYIPQSIYLVDDTIKKNIAFGINSNNIEEEKIIDAIKKAKLYDFIEQLPDGLDTIVGERGMRLSGGQRQRIGIARALYKDPEILIMDEATSALDNETEAAVMESIEGLHGMKTIIIIAHRLSTIRNADLIYEVGNGNVIIKSKKDVLGDG